MIAFMSTLFGRQSPDQDQTGIPDASLSRNPTERVVWGVLAAGSDAAAGAPEVDVEAGAVAVASGFAEFDEGEGSGAEGGFVEAFGHQEDFVGGGVEFLG